jgi:NADH pyrophosphatase NudC (nudix superfamily)
MADISLALLIVDDKVLLFKREDKKGDQFSGKYGLPGGHVEEKENTKEAAIRETWEETCLMMKNPTFVNKYKFEDNTLFLYAQELPNTNGVKLNHEHTDYKLFDPSELGKNPEIIPTTKFMYKDYINKVK